jgi:hypothetical protein
MASIAEIAEYFFVACDKSKGWEGCKTHWTPGAMFAVQAEPLADIHTFQQYTDWAKRLFTMLPDGRYDLKSLATDEKRQHVCVYGVWNAYRRWRSLPAHR